MILLRCLYFCLLVVLGTVLAPAPSLAQVNI